MGLDAGVANYVRAGLLACMSRIAHVCFIHAYYCAEGLHFSAFIVVNPISRCFLM